MHVPAISEGSTANSGHQARSKKRNNVISARRAVVEQEFSAERSALMDNLQEGAVVRGAVKNLTDYGAFVADGYRWPIAYHRHMAWRRVDTLPR